MKQPPKQVRARGERAPRGLSGVCLALAAFAGAPAVAGQTPPPAFSWAGSYTGFNLGAGVPLHVGERIEAASGFTTTAYDLYPSGRERAGLSFGAQAGYNWQAGVLVYGVETDFNMFDGRGAASGVYPAPASYWPMGVDAYSLDHHPAGKFFASLRGRAGVAVDRALLYVTGGVAAGGARGPATLALLGSGLDPFFAPHSQSSRMKYILGAGGEYAFDGGWSARLEYFFLNQSLNTHLFDNGAGRRFATRIRNENHVLRFGLNHNFGEKNQADGAGGAELYSVHGQSTNVVQGYPKFPALYSGENSFTPNGQAAFGSTTNLFMGLRLWEGGSAYVNPEISQGFGLSNSVGAASYTNGAVAKVGRAAPYMRFQRYFLRQIIGLDGGETEHDPDEGSHSEALESAQNQLAGKVDRDRLVVTVGKFAVGDVFDDNIYAHDPATGFLNFAFNAMGAFDYAADSWGYTHGLAVEWKQDWRTARAGVFQLSTIPNGLDIEPVLFRQYMGVGELEARYELAGQPGAIKFLAYGDNGYLSNIDEVIRIAYATGDFPPKIDSLRRRRVKLGGGINIKQQLMPNLGFFLRASMDDGRHETVDYTDIDHTVSTGLVAGGELWGRKDDEIGVAAAASGLSESRIRYFGLGGTSVYIGDGALSYAGEKNFEAYYKWGIRHGLEATFDYQFLLNPAHNNARGPMNVFAMRLRAAF